MSMRIVLLSAAFCGVAAVAGGAELKAAWFRSDITPQVGTRIAGYGPDDVSVGVLDPLYATGLALDDGERKALIVSFDLLGIDAPVIRELRRGGRDPRRARGLCPLHVHAHARRSAYADAERGREDETRLFH